MLTETEAPAKRGPVPLGTAAAAARLAMIAIVLGAIVAGFAYLAGWLTPGALTPSRFVDGFEKVDGVHDGFRRNHAKGVCVSGAFESNGQGARYSKGAVFQSGRVPVIGRFSLGGGKPYAADSPDAVRGLGLQFSTPGEEIWRTAMINLPVFVVSTPTAFYERLVASQPDPKTGKPDPEKMKAFLASHPETVAAMQIIKSQPPASGFANSTFYGLNAFRFVSATGESTPVRWFLKPDQPFAPASAAEPPTDKNYLFDGLIAKIHEKPLRWHLILIIGQPGDPTDDATKAWPANREQIDAGTLTLDGVESEEDSPTRDINFDPLVLPVGIEPSDDPLLSARSAVYSQSFTRRAGEPKQASAITPNDVKKGG
jgi:catalase